MTWGYPSNPGMWREETKPGRKAERDMRGIWHEISKAPDDGWGMRESEIKHKQRLKPKFMFYTTESTSRNLS